MAVEELVIIGQDTGDWGNDFNRSARMDGRPSGSPLPGLLRKMREIKGLRWIRLMYMHPHSFSDDLLNVFVESPELFPYLDMPLQHIDNEMLMDMKRKLPESDLRALVEKIRMKLPNLSLRTTFIVGYPGETDAQFTRLNDFVNEGHFDYLGAFTYSKEESTPAAIKTNQIPEDVKKERHEAIMSTHFNGAHLKAMKRLGSTETVLLEETEGEFVLGRTSREAPEIDAVVRLPQSVARNGQFIQAKLTQYDSYEFEATPV